MDGDRGRGGLGREWGHKGKIIGGGEVASAQEEAPGVDALLLRIDCGAKDSLFAGFVSFCESSSSEMARGQRGWLAGK